MPLTDVAIRAGKPRDREFKLSDGGGLYLLVKPNGTRLWNLAFRYGGRQKKLSLGAYPGCSLAEARAGRETAKAILKAGRDPAYEKQVSKRRRAESLATTVRAVGDEWLEKLRRDGLNAVTISKTDWLLGMAYSQVGDRPIADVTAPELLSVLRPIEASGRLETARRLRATLSRLMRYSIATGRAQRDPAADLQGAISAPTVRHHATLLEPRKVGALMRAIRDYDGHASVAAALRLAPLVFVRSAELRGGLWSELDEARAEWRIPAARMKKKRDHVVPLSTQAQVEFARLKAISGPSGLMFPSVRTVKRPISETLSTLL